MKTVAVATPNFRHLGPALAFHTAPGQNHPQMQTSTLPYLIDRYIIRQLGLALVLVTTGLVALIWLTQSLRFIQIIIDHGLSPFVFIKLTALLVPSFVATILPITCFIVVLFIYTRMSGDREVTIMRGIGLSDAALSRPALGVAVTATLLCYILNLGLVPAALSEFRNYQFEIRNQIAAFLLQPGVFTQVSPDITVYVQGRSADGNLRGILIEDSRDPSAPATILARSGQLMVDAHGPVVLLENGSIC
jgi:lipopolysaccharide export system permease protein